MSLAINDLVDDLLQPQQDCAVDHPTARAILARYGYYQLDDAASRVVGGDGVIDDRQTP